MEEVVENRDDSSVVSVLPSVSHRKMSYLDQLYQDKLRLIYVISILLGFIFRLGSSLKAYGLKHPDETFQSLEMAHYLVYGTGYIPPEFQNFNNDIPSYAAARSWLFPYFFAGLMWLGEFLGMDYYNGTLVMIKVYMAFHATLLIPAVYKFTLQLSKDRMSATMAAFAVAFWFRIIEFTVRTFTNTFFLPFIFYGLYKMFYNLEHSSFTILEYLEIGFLFGISTYIRLDMGILIFAFFLVYFNLGQLHHYLLTGFSSLLFWVWGAWIDYNQYEGVAFFSVPVNWFTFNVIENYSEFFGVSGPFAYIGLLVIKDFLVPWFIVILVWPVVHLVRRPAESILYTPLGRRFLKLTLVTIITWLIYSNIWPIVSLDPFSITLPDSHKEVRFMIGPVTMLLVISSIVTRLVLGSLPQIIDGRTGKAVDNYTIIDYRFSLYRRRILLVTVLLFIILSYRGFLIQTDSDHHEGINLSLMYIGQQGNAEKIVIGENWYNSGYYTYSHVGSSVEFQFLPLHIEEKQLYHYTLIKLIIESQTLNTYIVLPFYSFIFVENLENLLEDNGWTIVFELVSSDSSVSTWSII
ncbi:MAG: hypothetical protein ACXAE3_04555 [Candidatus Kariarchaeaceae archaeon]|jgi:hypothetical protein